MLKSPLPSPRRSLRTTAVAAAAAGVAVIACAVLLGACGGGTYVSGSRLAWCDDDAAPAADRDAAQCDDEEAGAAQGDDLAGSHEIAGAGDPTGEGEPGVFTGPSGRSGTVHVHEDGFTHTHGAGAPKTWTVNYTSTGRFVPERLDIITGDTVVFVNASDFYVWPASNIHPTHEILSSFDPKHAIPPGDSWSYTFLENGYWRYHNHIEASETGLVVSTGGPEKDLEPLDTTAPEISFAVAPADAGGEHLMDDEPALEQFVVNYGPAAAVAALKLVELDTGRDCHDAAHEVGHISWENFGAAAFGLVGHDCHAGALHGTVESLFAERGTSRLAQDVAAICSYTDNGFLVHQCMHGVGHGLLAWTTYELPEALTLCDLMPTVQNRQSCYGGVHMENGIGGLSGLMGHTTEYLDENDPHFPCNVLEEHHVPDCYFWQSSNLFWFGYDEAAVAEACREAPEGSVSSCFWSFGRDVGSRHREDPHQAARHCRLADTSDLITDCLRGAALSRFTEAANADFSAQLCTHAEADETVDIADGCWEVVWRDAPYIFLSAEEMRVFCDRITLDHRREACHGAVRA